LFQLLFKISKLDSDQQLSNHPVASYAYHTHQKTVLVPKVEKRCSYCKSRTNISIFFILYKFRI